MSKFYFWNFYWFLFTFFLSNLFLIIISLSIIGVLWGNKNIFLIIFLILIFLLGYFYVNYKLQNVLENEITEYFDSEIEVKGRVMGNPKDDLEIKKAVVTLEKTDSKILIYTNQNLNHNDEIIVSGKLIRPESFNNFDYRMYLANQGISGIIKNPKIEDYFKKIFFSF